MPRFFIDSPLSIGQTITLPPAQAHHAMRGLRLRDGDAVTLFNGQGGQYDGVVRFVDRNTVQVHLTQHQPIERETPLKITLIQSMATGEKMDWIVEKATELGAVCVVPMLSERSMARPPDAARAQKKCAHWQQVANSAAEQCGRNRLLQVAPMIDLNQALQQHAHGSLWLDADAPQLNQFWMNQRNHTATGNAAEVCIFIGPEGGWTPTERNAAVAAGVMPVSLGTRILRTETAGLVAISTLLALHTVTLV